MASKDDRDAKEKMKDIFQDFSFEILKSVFGALDLLLSRCNSFEDFKIGLSKTVDNLSKARKNMTSKEAIKLAYTEFQKDFKDGEETNQWLKDVIEGLKQAEKDLEILEILKKQITVTENRKNDEFGNYTTFYNLNITTKGLDFSQLIKIMEWLKNERK